MNYLAKKIVQFSLFNRLLLAGRVTVFNQYKRLQSKQFTDADVNGRTCVKCNVLHLLLWFVFVSKLKILNTFNFVCFGSGLSMLRWISGQGQDMHSSAFNCLNRKVSSDVVPQDRHQSALITCGKATQVNGPCLSSPDNIRGFGLIKIH